MRTIRLFVTALFAMLIGSSAWSACAGFTDVDSADTTYCSAVTYLKDKGITLGCTGTTYCPNAYVTRLQMALFLQRMGRGGSANVLDGNSNVIGGGNYNANHGYFATISGGYDNVILAGAENATIGGGSFNNSNGLYSTVSGGQSNTASGNSATVSGGIQNIASGHFSTVAGGGASIASGEFSFAAGKLAHADQDFCALFNLWGTNVAMNCIGSGNIVRIGALHGLSVDYYSQRPDGGGTRWFGVGDIFAGQTISTWTGAYLSDGGTWTNSSDRNAKTDVALIDPQTVLDKVAAMPIATWRYKAEADQVHLGPMAQDFHAAFGLGADDKHIATIDEGGVALAAIQGLNAKVQELMGRIANLEAQLTAAH